MRPQEASQVTEERRQSKRAAKGSAAVTEEQELAARAFPAAPTYAAAVQAPGAGRSQGLTGQAARRELDEDGTEYNAAAFCGPEEQWFAFVVSARLLLHAMAMGCLLTAAHPREATAAHGRGACLK